MPIPTSYKPKQREIKEYPVITPGNYLVTIKDVELLFDQTVYNSSELQDKYKFTFVIDDGEFKDQRVWMKTSTSMNAGYKGNASWLFQIFTSAYRANLTDEEALTVSVEDINTLVGKKIAVSLVNKDGNDGKVWTNVKGIFPAELGANLGFAQIKEHLPSQKNGVVFEKEAPVTNENKDFLTGEPIEDEPEIRVEDINF